MVPHFRPSHSAPFMTPALLRTFLALALSAPLAVAEEKVRFNEHIRPILSDKCFYCHGPDEKKREGGRRLDTREGALADHDGIRAIVPGKPEQSDLYLRISSQDKGEIMPTPKSKKTPLTEAEIALVRRWIEQGAEYEAHWAFLPLAQVAPPTVKNTAWKKNAIDAFILARLERDGLAPSPEADPATLVRRLHLDLTGLLPTPEEIATFTKAAASDEAYAAYVDALLASPHYGERWGRHWLDQARYADSHGYSIDGEREQWPYRDWVIKALNDDVPFDRFTIEQLAGDLLPKPTKLQLIATGFHRNTLINEEGGSDKEQFRVEAVMDRVNTTGAVWLGLTVGCAQCHTHKFDPITQREYFELFAFFNQGEDANDKGATIPVARGEVFGQASVEKDNPPAATATVPLPVAKWQPAQPVEFGTEANASFRLLEDGSLLSDQRAAFNDTYRVVLASPARPIAALRLRVLTDPSLPKNGPGLAGNGNFVLTDFEVRHAGQPVEITRAFADHEQPGYAVSGAIDDDPKSGWAINTTKDSAAKMNANHEAVFVFAKPVTGPLEIRLHHGLNKNYLIGRFALDFTDAIKAAAAPAKPKAPKKDGVADYMVMRDVPQPRPNFLLTRGDFTRPDHALGPLHPGGIAAISPALPAKAGRTRLDLAQWLVSPQNPLTPRVTVNRVWMRYFGRGLVETEEDFGSQASAPTHPELLDWLAGEFIRRGWSLKALHRLIVTSATYRQASKARPDLAEKDPRNLLLARQERLRVEAEIIRDAALGASGLLDRTIGGPSVRPPQPEGVYAFTQRAKKWTADTGPQRYRRALYTFFYRSAPHPLFGTFDAPDFQTTCTRRPRSNTPLQSLSLANDAAFLEIAAAFAQRLAKEATDLDAQIRRAFLLALSRDPSAQELTALRTYAQGEPEPQRLASLARVVLNTDNFITRE